MLLLEKPLILKNKFYLGLFLFNLALGNSSLQAADCGVLKLQKSRSVGTSIVSNTCANPNELSVQAVLKLPAGARLWLESSSALADSEHYQIICQNKSTNAFNIKVNSAVYPWISPEDARCNSWVNERLECNELNSDKKALYCSIAQVNALPSDRPLERTTSLALRGLKHNAPNTAPLTITQDTLDQWSASLKPEINLCRKVFVSTHPITLSWKINTSGDAMNTKIKETNLDQQLEDCITDVVESFKFPQLTKDTQVTLTF